MKQLSLPIPLIIVEDWPERLRELADALSMHEELFTLVFHAASYEDALACIGHCSRRQLPFAIISDWHLHGNDDHDRDGIDLYREVALIREEWRLKIPFIFQTGSFEKVRNELLDRDLSGAPPVFPKGPFLDQIASDEEELRTYLQLA